MSSVRAERLMWDRIPPDRWLTQAEMREIVADSPSHPMRDQLADAGIRWLLDGCWIRFRQVPSRKPRPKIVTQQDARLVAAEEQFGYELEYRRNPLEQVPSEAEQRAADNEVREHAVAAKVAKRAEIDERLRELGVIPT